MEMPEATNWPLEVNDQSTAVAFIRWCVGCLGMGYHPDTPFADYVDTNGQQCFAPDDAKRLDILQEQAFLYCDPYENGLAEFQRIDPTLGADPR